MKRMTNSDLVPVMNNTKWDELRLAMYSLGELRPKWRTKDVETGFISSWDGDWYYHFRNGGYESIEWAEIRVLSPEQETVVFNELIAIHVPGERTENGFRVFGYVPRGQTISYVA
ncbi:MAG: hypothetical protein L6R28_21385 [Planctomycetes bacterium]|nr:hypothetical protein [Planctomycetota bacterium]